MNGFVSFLVFAAAIGSGLIAGAFFVFSVAVMKALRVIPANPGIMAMQSINLVIINPFFLGVFIGTALISLVIATVSVINWSSAGTGFSLAGALLYGVGTFGVTIAFNVPLNNALAAADATSPAGHAVWERYLSSWTFWNHVRTIAAAAAMAAFVLALIQ